MKTPLRKNVGKMDRAVRIILGSVMILEGITGYCFGYSLLGISTKK